MENDPRIGKTIDHYKILSVLGGGGMGVVYKAEDINLKRIVALKFLALNLISNEQTKTRFLYEARAASALDHPRIGTIYQIGETSQGELYIAMAYYDGDTLKDRIEKKKITEKQALKYVTQIANGLAAAHEKDIVHRDVKPANMVITKDGFVKILDFGLAKLGDSTRITTEGTSMGTPAYMSPEQAKGHEVDHRSDIWSLGVIMYELLTGELPFLGQDSMSLMFNIVNTPPRLLSEIKADLKPGYQKILDKALAKKKEERYASLNEMLDELNSVDKLSEPEVDDQDTVILNPDEQQTLIIPEKESKGASQTPEAPKKKSKVKIFVPILAMVLGLGYIFLFRQTGPAGYLEINSDPSGAAIELNGELIASKTPAVLGPLKAGVYKVDVSLDGHQNVGRDFSVIADSTISHEFTLSLAEETATFIIKSNPPGAAIFVDGKPTGKKTPTSVNQIAPGNHDVELRLTGYKNTITTLSAEAGENKSWSIDLQKQVTVTEKPDIKKPKRKVEMPASLLVESEPSDAVIYLNGRRQAKKTPHRFEGLMPDVYLVQLFKDGYKEWKEQVTLRSGEDEKIKRNLKVKEKGQLRVLAFNGTAQMIHPKYTINGKTYDVTPLNLDLPEGVYIIEANHYLYEKQEKTVTIKSNERTIARFTFER